MRRRLSSTGGGGKGKSTGGRRSLIDRVGSTVADEVSGLQWADMSLPSDEKDDSGPGELDMGSSWFAFVCLLVFGIGIIILAALGHYFSVWSPLFYPDGTSPPTWANLWHSLLDAGEEQHELAFQVACVCIVCVTSIVFPIAGILTQYAASQVRRQRFIRADSIANLCALRFASFFSFSLPPSRS